MGKTLLSLYIYIYYTHHLQSSIVVSGNPGGENLDGNCLGHDATEQSRPLVLQKQRIEAT